MRDRPLRQARGPPLLFRQALTFTSYDDDVEQYFVYLRFEGSSRPHRQALRR